MKNKEILVIFNEVKKRYQGILSPSEQSEFWCTFGMTVYHEFLKEGFEQAFLQQQEENMQPIKDFMKTTNFRKWQNKQFNK